MVRLELAPIVLGHFATMARPGKRWPSVKSIIVFIFAPLVAGILGYAAGIEFDRETYNVSITFFGIFIALLLNIQVAIFSVFQRRWQEPDDERLRKIQEEKLEQRRKALGDFNANLSFLTLFCCAALIVFLCVYAFQWSSPLVTGIALFSYSHFLLTLLMCVSGAHTLFQKEYGRA